MRGVLAVLGAVVAGCGAPVASGDAGASDAAGAEAAADGGRDACVPVGGSDGVILLDRATGRSDSRSALRLSCALEGADVLVCRDVAEGPLPTGLEVRLRFPGGWRAPTPGTGPELGVGFSIDRVTPWGRPADEGPWLGYVLIRSAGNDPSGVPYPPVLVGYACGARFSARFDTALVVP